jgi:hypothetical protein
MRSNDDIDVSEKITEIELMPLEVKENGSVFLCLKLSTETTAYKRQRWRKVSMDSFNLLYIWDTHPDFSKMMVCDTKELSCLHLSLSMAELNLLTSLYYDNMFELPQFINRDHELGDEIIDTKVSLRCRDDTLVRRKSEYYSHL